MAVDAGQQPRALIHRRPRLVNFQSTSGSLASAPIQLVVSAHSPQVQSSEASLEQRQRREPIRASGKETRKGEGAKPAAGRAAESEIPIMGTVFGAHVPAVGLRRPFSVAAERRRSV